MPKKFVVALIVMMMSFPAQAKTTIPQEFLTQRAKTQSQRVDPAQEIRNYVKNEQARNKQQKQQAKKQAQPTPKQPAQQPQAPKQQAQQPAPKQQQKQTTAPKAVTKYSPKVNSFLNDARWKPGTPFGGAQRPKLSGWKCRGCMAYAADFVKYVYGKDSPREGTAFTKLSQVRAGDILQVTNAHHWIVVLGRNGNSLETVEGNWTGKVVKENGAYTINGNTLMRNGKRFRTFSNGYHF